jgi:hypothetical protein
MEKKHEHIYQLHLECVDNCVELSKHLKSEVMKCVKYWDHNNTLENPLFTKKELLRMIEMDLIDFQNLIVRELGVLRDRIIKNEGSDQVNQINGEDQTPPVI